MTIASLLFYGAIALWSAFLAYVLIEQFVPMKKQESETPIPSPQPLVSREESTPTVSAPVSRFDLREGFKSFQTGAELTVEDIVKGLSRR